MTDLTIARKQIEKLYFDKFSAIQRVKTKDPETGITGFSEETYIEKQPCKLSFGSFPQTGEGVVAALSFHAKIITSPDLDIKEGSKIIAIKKGKEYILKNSGIPRMGINHQEIMLETWDDYA